MTDSNKPTTGFVRSKKALTEAGLDEQKSTKRFEYVRKNTMPVFHFALVPETEGYQPRPIRFHRNIANLPVGKSNYNVASTCLKDDCPGCKAAYKQMKEIPYEQRGRDFYKIDKKKQQSQYFVVYEVTMTASGTPVIQQGVSPKLLDYRYNRAGNCPDWEDFMDAYEDALARGLDPQNPDAAVVFQVKQQKEPVPNTNMMRTAYKHSVVDTTVALPETHTADLAATANLDNLFITLEKDDLQRIIAADQEIQAIKAEGGSSTAIEAAIDRLAEVESKDFQRILTYFREKDQDKAGDSNSIASEVRRATATSYSQQANTDMSSSGSADTTTSATPAQPTAAADGDSSTMSARERILKIKRDRQAQQQD